MRERKRKRRKQLKLLTGCPKCGSHLTKESGFYRCTKCKHTLFQSGPGYGHGGYSLDVGMEGAGYYRWRGMWGKLAGTEKDVVEQIRKGKE